MDAATRERGLEHVRRCTPCATLLVEERALSRDLRALSARCSAEEIPERIETALLTAFRQRAAAPVCRAAKTPLVAGCGGARIADIRYFAGGMDRVVSQARVPGVWF